MKIYGWTLIFIVLLHVSIFGQNLPDSIIVDTVLVAFNPGIRIDTVVSVYFVIDDTSVGLWLPINWYSLDGQIFPDNLPPLWNYPFTDWNTHDSIDYSGRMIRLSAEIDNISDPVLYSGGQRILAFRVRFVILPTASAQVMMINEGIDPFLGPAIFADPYGGPGIDPIFKNGYIRYGANAWADESSVVSIPAIFRQNFPNPFNMETTIEYSIVSENYVNITIYNVLGKKITELFDNIQQVGDYSITWSAKGLSSGVYFAKIQVGNEDQIIKMVLIK